MYVPFCGLAVLEALSDRSTGVQDPLLRDQQSQDDGQLPVGTKQENHFILASALIYITALFEQARTLAHTVCVAPVNLWDFGNERLPDKKFCSKPRRSFEAPPKYVFHYLRCFASYFQIGDAHPYVTR